MGALADGQAALQRAVAQMQARLLTLEQVRAQSTCTAVASIASLPASAPVASGPHTDSWDAPGWYSEC